MSTADDPIFDGLTDAQREAVAHVDGPLLVLAGPGSGKTTVVTRRVANLIAQGIPAWQILALTFTNKAAGEMAERIDRLVPPDVPGRRGLTVATFHSFCARMLRRYAIDAGIAERFSIYDTADQRDALKQALHQAGMSSKNWTPAAVGGAISNAKNDLLNAAEFAALADDFYNRSVAKAYRAYEDILRANDALDFDDLLLVMAKMLKGNHAVRTDLQERYQYLLIDEYQDTNHAQFLIAHSLAQQHHNICVVGDPDQSIYAWRGADIRNILEFEDHYPEATIIPLGQNFRSTGAIVAAAEQLILNNRRRKHKKLFTELEEGNRPQIVLCRDEHHEAQLIVDGFRRLNVEHGVAWKDMAVLYRINALSRVLEEAFRSSHVPYVIARGTAFYERKEIKDALAYLRVLANPNDEVSLRRIINTPPRGIGKTTIEKIELHAIGNQVRFYDAMRQATMVNGLTPRAVSAVEKFVALLESWRAMASDDARPDLLPSNGESTLAGLVDTVIRESGLEGVYKKSRAEEDQERLENLGELVSAASEFIMPAQVDDPSDYDSGDDEAGDAAGTQNVGGSTLDQLSGFLESIALVSDADAVDPARGAVTLMTLHAAKGLEFHAVAMAGLEDGLLPHSRSHTSEEQLEEERRLCFVGITRARRDLLLTSAAVRTHRGVRERTIPSTFLRELEGEHVLISNQSSEFASHGDDDDKPWDDYDVDQRDHRLDIGVTVRHPKFGTGVVEAVMLRPAGSSARIRFDRVGTKTLILEYAKLERVEGV